MICEARVMQPAESRSWTTLTIDCADADALGAFYSQLLGWEITACDGEGWLQLRNPEGGIGLNIQAEVAFEPPIWPEQPGRQAKMMHLEVLVDDLEVAVGLVLDWGGTEASHQPVDRDRSLSSHHARPGGPPVLPVRRRRVADTRRDRPFTGIDEANYDHANAASPGSRRDRRPRRRCAS